MQHGEGADRRRRTRPGRTRSVASPMTTRRCRRRYRSVSCPAAVGVDLHRGQPRTLCRSQSVAAPGSRADLQHGRAGSSCRAEPGQDLGLRCTPPTPGWRKLGCSSFMVTTLGSGPLRPTAYAAMLCRRTDMVWRAAAEPAAAVVVVTFPMPRAGGSTGTPITIISWPGRPAACSPSAPPGCGLGAAADPGAVDPGRGAARDADRGPPPPCGRCTSAAARARSPGPSRTPVAAGPLLTELIGYLERTAP